MRPKTGSSPTRPHHIGYEPFPLTAAMHRDGHRFKVICAGRRIGKTLFAIMESWGVLRSASFSTHQPARGMIVAPTFKLVREDWMAMETLLAPSITYRNQAEMTMRLQDGHALADVEFNSADAEHGVGRGGGFDVVLLDEAARIPERIWQEELRPAIADRRGRAIFISTPYGRNWFYRLWLLGQEHPDYASWQYTTWQGWASRCARQPDLLSAYQQEWAQIQATTSQRTFQQEYLAQFLEQEGQLFSVGKCLRGQLRAALPGRHYLAGLDVARLQDWMVTLILEQETRQVVALHRSRHPSWDVQKQEAAYLLRQYPHVRVLIDSTGVGDPIAQDMRSAGFEIEDVTFTSRRKQELVENLTVALDHGAIGLPDQAESLWLLEELRSYQAMQAPSGHLTYRAPEGMHDDGVTALMLACWGVRFDLQRPVVEDAPAERDAYSIHEMLEYGRRLSRWQSLFPSRLLPSHPHDLRWKLAGFHG